MYIHVHVRGVENMVATSASVNMFSWCDACTAKNRFHGVSVLLLQLTLL